MGPHPVTWRELRTQVTRLTYQTPQPRLALLKRARGPAWDPVWGPAARPVAARCAMWSGCLPLGDGGLPGAMCTWDHSTRQGTTTGPNLRSGLHRDEVLSCCRECLSHGPSVTKRSPHTSREHPPPHMATTLLVDLNARVRTPHCSPETGHGAQGELRDSLTSLPALA